MFQDDLGNDNVYTPFGHFQFNKGTFKCRNITWDMIERDKFGNINDPFNHTLTNSKGEIMQYASTYSYCWLLIDGRAALVNDYDSENEHTAFIDLNTLSTIEVKKGYVDLVRDKFILTEVTQNGEIQTEIKGGMQQYSYYKEIDLEKTTIIIGAYSGNVIEVDNKRKQLKITSLMGAPGDDYPQFTFLMTRFVYVYMFENYIISEKPPIQVGESKFKIVEITDHISKIVNIESGKHTKAAIRGALVECAEL